MQSELVRQISTGGGTSKLPSSVSKKREGENDDFIDVAVLQKKSKHEQSTVRRYDSSRKTSDQIFLQ